MKYLTFSAAFFLFLGLLTIVFSRQLGYLYEGTEPTMSDLGFIADGMVLIALSGIFFAVSLFLKIKRHAFPRRV